MRLLSVPFALPIDPIFGSGIAIMPPARVSGRLTSRRLISSSRGAIFGQSDPHRGAVWLVGHIPPGKLRVGFDNLSMHSCVPDRMSEFPHVPLRADVIVRCRRYRLGEATIRTRGGNRMSGTKHSRPRTDLVALSRGAPGEELSVPLASLSLSSAPRRRCSSRARVPPARLGHAS